MTDEQIIDRVLVQDGCWEYAQVRSDERLKPNTYGYFHIDRGRRMAHREVYRILVGPIPGGMQLHHTCQNTACVNPGHLEPLTPLAHKRRHPHSFKSRTCPQGHEEWTYRLDVAKRLIRYCRGCARERMRRVRQ